MQTMCFEKSKYVVALKALIGISFFLAGLYYELACAVISAALLAWLVLYSRQDAIIFRKNISALTILIYFAAYVITPLWAIDNGLAVFGIAKALPVLLFAICLMQLDIQERNELMLDLPLWGSCMVNVSFLLRWIPVLQDFFLINGRLGGFFQYPNTFACFLLICFEMLLLDEQKQIGWPKIAEGIVLAFGFLQAGSRAVFLIGILGVGASLFLKREKKTIVTGVAGIVGGVLLNIVTERFAESATEHMLDISTNASTFLGRLLYWKDAMPMIWQHPFGTGYLGYYFMQGTFQTGVYSVRWVHNDFLQILLDIGWIPAVFCVVALVQALKAKMVMPWQKIILSTLILHTLFDFDLQYVSIFFVLLLNLDWDGGEVIKIKRKRLLVGISAAVVVVALWMGILAILTTFGNNETAVKVYPRNTLSQLQLLMDETDIDTFDARSKKILRQNEYATIAWNAQAEVARQNGDFAEVVRAKREAISHNKYDIKEYTDYMDKLLEGADLYRKSGQNENAKLCLEEILTIPERLNEVLDGTSALAWKITDTPQLTLPQAYLDILQTINEELGGERS